MYCYARFQNCTFTLWGTTDLHSSCTQPVVPVRQCTSGSCNDPYTKCMKMLVASECSLWYGVLPYKLWELYIYCIRHHGSTQLVCPAYGTCKAMYVREMYRSIQRVYENVVSVIVIPLVWCTAMQVFGFVHLLYKAPRILIVGVDSLRQSYTDVCQGAVQICIA